MQGQDKQAFDTFVPRLIPAEGHTAQIRCAQFSPDGKHIATGSADQTVKIWDITSGKIIDKLNHTKAVHTLQYNMDGSQIVTTGPDQIGQIWDARSGELTHNLIGHHEGLTSAYFSPDGKLILTASFDHTAKVWDSETGKLIHDLKGHNDIVSNAIFNHDGTLIASVGVGIDQTVKIWDTAKGMQIQSLNVSKGLLRSIQFSPDGKHIATADKDSIAKVWDINTGKLILKLSGHTGLVSIVKYSPDGKQIATGSKDQTVKIWDAYSGRLIHDIAAHKHWLLVIDFSADGKQLLTTSYDKTAKVWDTNTGNNIHIFEGHTKDVVAAGYDRSGKKIVTASVDKSAKVWDAKTGRLILNLKGKTDIIVYAQYSPNGMKIVTAGYDKTAKVWNANTGKLIHSTIEHNGYVNSIECSPDAKEVVAISNNPTTKIWETASGKLIHELEGHSVGIRSVRYSSNGMKIVTAGYDKTAKVWDASSGELIHDLIGHSQSLNNAYFSPDSKQIITTSWDKTAKVWNADRGTLIYDMIDFKGIIEIVEYSPNGKQFATATRTDNELYLWNASSGKQIQTLKGHDLPVSAIRFHPNGNQLITSSYDHTAKVWDPHTGTLLHDLKSHTGWVYDVKYSLDTKQIVTASYDHTAKVWDANSGQLIHTLPNRAGVTQVTFNEDGSLIILLLSDGSLAFWDRETGKALLNLYPLEGANWVVIHPSGLFDASPEAMNWMYFLIGQEVIEFEQLKERYYEPGLFEKIIARNESLRDVEAFTSVKMYPDIESSIKEHELHIQLKERNGGIGKISLFINNKEVIPDANANRDTVLDIDLTQFKKYYLLDTLNSISIRAYNEDGWLKSNAIIHNYTPKLSNKKEKGEGAGPLMIRLSHDPHLYAVVIGTSDYVGENLDLQFADKDSKDIANAIKQSADLLFGREKVHLNWFTSESITGSKPGSKSNIKAAFDSIAKVAKAEDILLVYLSGHGVTFGGTGNEQFYYLTKDVYSGDLSDPQIRSNYTISTEEMTQWINDIAAQKQVMILDACSSGKVVENLLAVRNVPASQIRALDRMKDRTGMFVLAGSAADKVSYEASQYGQGLLTYSLLLGMSGAALKDGQSVDVMNLFQFARDQVPEFANDIGGVQTPTLAFPTDASSFDIGLVTDEIKIPLQQIKPLFTRSSFQEEDSFRDIIRLSKALDTHLIDATSSATSRGIIFIDVDEYESAYSVNGRYYIDGDNVSLQGRLYKGKQQLGDFIVAGDKNQMEIIVMDILNKVVNMINQ